MLKIYYILFAVFPTTIFAQELTETSLKDCQTMAREHHPYAAEQQRIDDATSLKQKNNSAQWLPQLNASAQATYQSDALSLNMLRPDLSTPVPTFTSVKIETPKDQYKITLDVNQMLYDGGSVKALKNATEASSKSDLFQNEAELLKVEEMVQLLYFNILLSNERLDLLKTVRINFEERKKSVEAGLKSGVLQPSDLDNINIELLKNQQQIDEITIGRKYLFTNLSELTGKSFAENTKLQIPEIIMDDSVSFNRPEIEALTAQQQSVNFNADIVKSQRFPRLYAFAQAGYGRPGLNMMNNEFDNFYIVGLSFKWTIWDWSKSRHDRQVLNLQTSMLENKKSAINQNFNIQLNNSRSNIEQLEKSLSTDKEIVNLRKEVSKRSASRLDNGIITAADYINDQNAEIQAIIQMQTREMQLLKEKINYLMIQGKHIN